ncbi:hypothetical protein LXA43DRAFT_1042241, partial [Ganoderma leucocontextum]
CPGYLLNISENHADGTDSRKYKIDGALISVADQDLIEEGRPNFFLDDLSIEFKRGGTEKDAWDDHAKKDMEANALTRMGVRGQLMSYGERHFYFQHGTGLFMLLVNGGEFRVIRWDRSGCIVTEALNYVDTPEHTKKLLEFFYAYSKASPKQRGIDTTATRLPKKSCGRLWMQRVAAAHPGDLAHADGTVVQSVPEGFVVKPTRDGPTSSLFATNILADDPTATTGFGDLSSASATTAIVPVFKYVRDLFRASISESWLCYSLNVCGRDYLVGKPIFAPHGLVGRGTRGYVALEWKTQRLVFLKDAWRPFYHGVDQEGTTLEKLNAANISFVPTLICHEDVGGPGAQETEASQYSSTGSKKRDVLGEQEKKDRPIAPMPGSRSKGTRSGASTTRRTQKSSGSGSKGNKRTDATNAGTRSQSSGERSGKRSRPQDTAVVAPKDGLGLRHMTHYRIVVAEVCLTSTEIRSSEQLIQVIWHCMTGHRDAAVKCGLLHRDVSTGNILIRPEVACINPETGESIVLWYGVLSDWEIAKALPKDDSNKARQPHRTGTWYYMSVYSLTYPRLPVSIADELESFFHVLIYLAVRLLRTSSLNIGGFIDSYFEAFELDCNNRAICGSLKKEIIQTGSLMWNEKPIRFLSAPPSEDQGVQLQDDSECLSPLNDIVAKYLAYFEARYAVLKYESQAKKGDPKPLPSLQTAIEAATSSSAAAARAREIRLAREQAMGLHDPSESDSPDPVPTPDSHRPKKPPQSVYEMAGKLSDHDAVLKMLVKEARTRVWPSDDYAGDQLVGYIPRELQSTAKRARLQVQSTMQAIPEGEELPERAHTAA